MSEVNQYQAEELDINIDDILVEYETRIAHPAAETALQLGTIAMRFAKVERVPRYDEHSRENDAEHSFMLSLVATELADTYFPHLDSGLVAKFGNVHDLVELETGDIATFSISDEDLSAKHQNEHRALDKILNILPPQTANLLRRYEQQQEPEARFVRFVDKVLPWIVDIIGPGCKVMEEDYNVFTILDLKEANAVLSERELLMFPEPSLRLVHNIRDILADKFSEQFANSLNA